MVPHHDEGSYLAALAAVGRLLEERRAARDDEPSGRPPHELVRRERGDQFVRDGDGLHP